MTITVDDYMYYGEEFFAKYRFVQDQIPQASTEEVLQIMEMLGKIVVQAKEDELSKRRPLAPSRRFAR